MLTNLPKIKRMLLSTAKTPQMYAHSVEAMLMRVSTLLEVSGVQFSVVEFYCKHGGRQGNAYLLEKPENLSFDAWTQIMVDDAIEMLERENNVNNHEADACGPVGSDVGPEVSSVGVSKA
jgi:hypothetical protein